MHTSAQFYTLLHQLTPVNTMSKDRLNATLDHDAFDVLMREARKQRRSPGNMATMIILEWAMLTGRIKQHELPEPDEPDSGEDADRE